jgi:hypothetical protein
MKKLFLAMALVLVMVGVASANPFIVCDPQTGVQYYKVTGAAWVASPVTAQADGSIKMDIVGAPTGTSNLNFSACLNDPVWGELCSVTAPFSFTKPTAPILPAGVKLVK